MFPEKFPLVPGKFRHLPVVENGEVIALLDIAKCLYDAIARSSVICLSLSYSTQQASFKCSTSTGGMIGGTHEDLVGRKGIYWEMVLGQALDRAE